MTNNSNTIAAILHNLAVANYYELKYHNERLVSQETEELDKTKNLAMKEFIDSKKEEGVGPDYNLDTNEISLNASDYINKPKQEKLLSKIDQLKKEFYQKSKSAEDVRMIKYAYLHEKQISEFSKVSSI
jgi:hypothetical protein